MCACAVGVGDADVSAGGCAAGQAGFQAECEHITSDTVVGQGNGGCGGAVVNFVGGLSHNVERSRVNGAGGVADVGDFVVDPAIAVQHADAVGGDGFVVVANVFVGKRQAAGAQGVSAKQGATGDIAGAGRCQRAVIGFADVAGGDGQCCGVHTHLVGTTDQGVVARQARIAVAQCQATQIHGLADTNVLVDHAAGAAEGQVLTSDHTTQAENAGGQCVGAVVGAHA